jgi:hypothetical protein
MTDVFKLIEDHGLTLHGDIEHFAELVRADEREACARLLENGRFLHDEAPAAILAKEAAKAIRKRGER